MAEIFKVIFYQPLFNLLVYFYNLVPGNDIGVAIIVLTVIIKLILYPLSIKSLKSQKALQDLQPKIEALKVKYKNQQEKLTTEMMALYKKEKVNPFSSCLPLLIQFPFLIAVYQVFRAGLSNGSFDQLYPFITNPGQINPVAFGFVDLSSPQILLAILAGAAQFWQSKMLIAKKPEVVSSGSKDENMMATMNRQMTFMMPIMTIIIGFSLPGGLVLYWFIMTLLTILQQQLILKRQKNQSPSISQIN
ncbi:MAG TPA: YidC/Oxa1 family membrane protein insertase [bacterium]|nr:YidC/Oxa1 family membrane protein insertase [bacterium]HPN81472.1 YidC/Oxa1 family membrane protein insertase [bacterium]HPW39534.1 YidC/Oxa1 family membrane protein insertase [bacterium]